MAQKLQNITLGSPGFYGLNTESSPVEMPPQFCAQADNAIIDDYGRLGARKGFSVQTDVITDLGGGVVKRVFEGSIDGTNYLFAVGNNKIFRVDTTTTTNDTLTELTLPAAYTITADNWAFTDFNKEGFFFQEGHAPLLVNATSLAADDIETLDSESSESVPAAPEGNMVVGAFGRLWAAGVSTAKSTVYWSDTLIGDGWTEGASGSIDITTVWPNGYDEITALAVHNGRLIIFGQNSVVIYAGAEDPSTMALEDTIIGTGCSERDSVQNTGEDIIFLSPTGVRLLSRTLSESSLPMRQLTFNVRSQIIADVGAETVGVDSVYSAEEGIYLLLLEGLSFAYCLDMKKPLEDGSLRVTVWPGITFNCATRTDDGLLYLGGAAGVGTYDGYQDDGTSYYWVYNSPDLTFETPANLKFPKKIRPVIIGATGQVATVTWAFDYGSDSRTATVIVGSGGSVSEYGVGEYNIAEYGAGEAISTTAVNTSGDGTELRIGLSVDINGAAFSLQQMNVQALIGRLI